MCGSTDDTAACHERAKAVVAAAQFRVNKVPLVVEAAKKYCYSAFSSFVCGARLVQLSDLLHNWKSSRLERLVNEQTDECGFF